ncbi:MAG: hypothetical protein E7Z99_06370 [Coriobacteriaceae bacterium]|nr:hypothetical protein [Coriobacteriaceae bacterium]
MVAPRVAGGRFALPPLVGSYSGSAEPHPPDLGSAEPQPVQVGSAEPQPPCIGSALPQPPFFGSALPQPPETPHRATRFRFLLMMFPPVGRVPSL